MPRVYVIGEFTAEEHLRASARRLDNELAHATLEAAEVFEAASYAALGRFAPKVRRDDLLEIDPSTPFGGTYKTTIRVHGLALAFEAGAGLFSPTNPDYIYPKQGQLEPLKSDPVLFGKAKPPLSRQKRGSIRGDLHGGSQRWHWLGSPFKGFLGLRSKGYPGTNFIEIAEAGTRNEIEALYESAVDRALR